jgi:translation initiation factor IF-2
MLLSSLSSIIPVLPPQPVSFVMFRSRASCAVFAATQMRYQSQSYHRHNIPFVEGEVQHAHRGGSRNAKKLDADNIPHFVKCTILNDRREMGLAEVDDWRAFADDAIYIPTRAGPLWVGPDDPRAEKLMKRKEKLLAKPGQVTRRMPKSDPAKDLESHPLRRYFTTKLKGMESYARTLLLSGLRSYIIPFVSRLRVCRKSSLPPSVL